MADSEKKPEKYWDLIQKRQAGVDTIACETSIWKVLCQEVLRFSVCAVLRCACVSSPLEKVGNISLCPKKQPLTGLVALWDWHIHYGLPRIPYSPHSFHYSSKIIQICKPSISLEYICFESLHFLKVQHGT